MTGSKCIKGYSVITHYGEQDKNRDNKTRYNAKNALIELSY